MSLLKQALGNYGIAVADQKQREFADLLNSFDDRTLVAFGQTAIDKCLDANDARLRGSATFTTDATIARTAFDALALAVIAEMDRRDEEAR